MISPASDLALWILATELTPGQTNFDPAEDIRLERHSLQDLLDKIYDGTIQDGKTVAGILAYAAMRKESTR